MTQALLKMTGVKKSYPGVRALQGVDLELAAGEVLALLGENGAGKSTLIKILSGAVTPDSGTIELEGKVVRIAGPLDAQRLGISVIHQEFNLVPTLTARENIFLGQEPSRFSWIPRRAERDRAADLFRRIGVSVDAESLCRDLTVAQQQVVEIAKALALDAKVIVMDEPSAALSPREVEGLLKIVEELTSHGIGLIYISHRLGEVFELADRVTVLRDGQHVATRRIDELTRDTVIELMVGTTLENEFPPRADVVEGCAAGTKPADGLEVADLGRGQFPREVSFRARRGEILAITGLVGAGRTETARLIFGADRADQGTIFLDGRPLSIRSPRQAIAAGICLLTEDRKSQGLVLSRSVQDNFALPNLNRFAWVGFIQQKREDAAFDGYVSQLQIRLADRRQLAATLSGGNQQKVVLAKWLERNAEVVIFDEPTRGIDVGAKVEIYKLMRQLVEQSKVVIMISSEFPEVLGMADRILVMHDGRITGEITEIAGASQEQIMELAVS